MTRKTVVLCGSMLFFDLMQKIAERMALEKGWIALCPIAHVLGRELTEEEKQRLGELHRAKIDLSDAVYIICPGGYMGSSVRAEIEYARSMHKEIIYLQEGEENLI